jgi:hypothetical protein
MKVVTIKDAAVLIPNKEHENFTDSGEVIEKNTELKGKSVEIAGLRRGKPFTYKMFVTEDKKIIYLNTIKPMETTEVTLGADSSQSPTRVNFIPAETFNKLRTTGIVVGGIAGFAWAKYKKHDMKKVAMYIGLGAVIGYFAAYVIDSRKDATVKESK